MAIWSRLIFKVAPFHVTERVWGVCRSAPEFSYFVLACSVGAVVGLVGGVFHRAIDALSGWPSLLKLSQPGWLSILLVALVTAILTVSGAWLVRRFAPEAAGSGVQEIEGVMADQRRLRWQRVLPVKFFGGIASLSSGLVLGREGPTIHIGASVAGAFAGYLRLNEVDRKGMLAAGAAAGLACAFNAPLAATIFVVEEMRRHFPYSFKNLTAVGLACVLATAMADALGGRAPDLSMPVSSDPPALSLLPWFALLGCVMGVLGVLLNRSLLFMGTVVPRCHRRAPYVFQAVVGAAAGVLLAVFPMAVTGGEQLVRDLGVTTPSLALLLGLVVLRFATTVLSYATGVPGGIFAPILSLAMCAGLAFGVLVQWGVPNMTADPVLFGLAAMGGLFTASVHAPLVGIVLIAELTGAYSLLLPLMLTCLCALTMARALRGQPIYEALLERLLRN